MESSGNLHELTAPQHDNESTAYLNPTTPILGASTAESSEHHRNLEDPVDLHRNLDDQSQDAHSSFMSFDQGSQGDIFNSTSASQVAAAVAAAAGPYTFYSPSNIYDVGNNYSSLSSIPLTSAMMNTSTSPISSNIQQLTGGGNPSSQLLSFNGSTYIIQPSVQMDQLINGCRSGSPDVENLPSNSGLEAKQQPGHSRSSSQDLTSIQAQGLQSYITRVSPATIQWLLQNYETAEGVSLPRSTLYNHYLRHCEDSKQDPVNAASFGKLIRSVFLGLRTRRIGTRGNSKYHYYGIRLKPGSILNQLSDVEPHQQSQESKQNGVARKRLTYQTTKPHDSGSIPDQLSSSQVKQYLGSVSNEVPGLPQLIISKEGLASSHLEEDTFKEFEDIYKDHCCQILEAVSSLNFSSIEKIWAEFWTGQSSTRADTEVNDDISMDNIDLKLNASSWQSLLHLSNVQNYIQEVDYAFYQYIVNVLMPNVLSVIPNSLTQAVRNFAKNLETWMQAAVEKLPGELKQIKLNAVKSLAQTLRRYTGLNHLAQAARAVLQNSHQISQMLADLNRVDFGNVQEQATWVCQCDAVMVQKLEDEFKALLQEQADLEKWSKWLQSVVDKALKPYENKSDFTKAARQFLLRWSFYSSMVIRDLTLRSAPSFGSFHLIRLLYDEYMFYLIEHRVASSLGQTPVAVMGLGRVKAMLQQQANLQGDDKPVAAKSSIHVNNNNNSKMVVIKQEEQREFGIESKKLKTL